MRYDLRLTLCVPLSYSGISHLLYGCPTGLLELPFFLPSGSELVSLYVWFFKPLSSCLWVFFFMLVYLFFNSSLIGVSNCEGTEYSGKCFSFPTWFGLLCRLVVLLTAESSLLYFWSEISLFALGYLKSRKISLSKVHVIPDLMDLKCSIVWAQTSSLSSLGQLFPLLFS